MKLTRRAFFAAIAAIAGLPALLKARTRTNPRPPVGGRRVVGGAQTFCEESGLNNEWLDLQFIPDCPPNSIVHQVLANGKPFESLPSDNKIDAYRRRNGVNVVNVRLKHDFANFENGIPKFQFVVSPGPAEHEVLDARKMLWRTEEDWADRRCLVVVDGKEERLAWYIDTRRGIVKTYDVLGDGKSHMLHEIPVDAQGVEFLEGRLASRTIYSQNISIQPFVGGQ